jgi:transposase
MRVMAAPRKCPDELRERSTRMAVEARQDPVTRAGALPRIAKQLGIKPGDVAQLCHPG